MPTKKPKNEDYKKGPKSLTNMDVKKKAMIKALEKTLGIASQACKLVGISRESHYQWMRKDPKYKKKVEAVGELVLDFSESALHDQIGSGNVVATIFHLKTKGKSRGYIESHEVKAEITSKLSDDDIKTILEKAGLADKPSALDKLAETDEP